MRYKIADAVAFDEREGALENLASGEKLMLPLTACMTLAFLIEHQGQAISRDEIFRNVWDKYGYKASNNTLNQYISLIRRHLTDLGAGRDIIVTLPKVGFIIPSEVKIERDDDSEHNSPAAPQTERPTARQPSQQKYSLLLLLRQHTTIFLALLFSILLTGIGIIWHYTSPDMYEPPLIKIGDIETCPVFLLGKVSENNKDKVIALVKSITYRHNLPCIAGSEFLFQAQDTVLYNQSGRIFLSRCETAIDNRDELSSCKDIMTYE
ncbi:MAG: winged helix-turn-helix domain-containing protein [Aeromonadaceae bacterium]